MRFDRLTPAHVRQAVAIYLEHAWPPGSPGSPPVTVADLEGATTLREMRDLFDRPPQGSNVPSRRYTLRLGNSRYPWMKLAVQEYLVEDEFFFSVDTHDDLSIDPSMPDYEAWLEIRNHNAELKREIEAAWAAADLPTHGDLRALCEGIARLEHEEDGDSRGRVLVVDDDQDVATGLARLLGARGYEVETVFDGRQVLERMSCDPLPDLVVLDYAMPEFDGHEVMRRLRGDERTRDVPILLATATDIDLGTIQAASGLLRKPYPREALFRMIDQLLADDGTG